MQNRLNYSRHPKKVSMLQNHYILFISKLYETFAVCIKNCFVGVVSHPKGKGAPKFVDVRGQKGKATVRGSSKT